MSRRTSIIKALSAKFQEIAGSPYNTDVSGNSFPKLKFWDEVNDFPSIYMSAGSEAREYHPGAFAWGFLNISIKAYTKGEDPQEQLELLLEDIETVLDSTLGVLVYDTINGYETSEISITSITTDEGLLAPYGIGEVNILVRYQVM
jgi:hypothetical protein